MNASTVTGPDHPVSDPAPIGVLTALRALTPISRPYWPRLAAAIVLLTIGGICQTGIIYVFGAIVNAVLTRGSLATFGLYAGAWGALAVTGSAASFAGGYLTTWASERVVLRLRDEMFTRVQHALPAVLSQYDPGDVLARLTSDIDSVEQLASSGIVQAAGAGLSAVCFAGAAFWVQWKLALAVCAATPLFWLVSRALSARMAGASRQERARNAALISVVEQALSFLSLARLYNRQADEAAVVHYAGRSWMRAGLRRARLSQAYRPTWEILETASALGILALGAWLISVHQLSLGGLLSFVGFLGFLYPSLQALGGLAVEATGAAAAAGRLLPLWQTPTVPPDPVGPVFTPRAGGIQLDHVSFRYPGSEALTLDAASLTILPGEIVAIRGPSGGGKSTLAALLVRLLEPSAGLISLGGIPITEFPPDVVRQMVTLMPQQDALLPTSIAANIAYGRPGATPRQIADAALAAGAHDFIARLPAGYQTLIGPGGQELSGGQARRVALARALVRESPVLILDEPTGGLDADTARRIASSVHAAATRRAWTTILITHDPDLAAIADRTLVLASGKVQEEASPSAVPAARIPDEAPTNTFGTISTAPVAELPGPRREAASPAIAAAGDPDEAPTNTFGALVARSEAPKPSWTPGPSWTHRPSEPSWTPRAAEPSWTPRPADPS